MRVIGSGALFLQTDYDRATKDGDVLETLQLTAEIKEKLTALAGKRTPLHKRTGLYLDIVLPGLPFLPHGPRFHLLKTLNDDLRHFSIEALDVTDVAVSKLKRFNQSDADDVRAMIDKDFVKHGILIERFKAAVDGFSMDSRAGDFPHFIENLHRVERDMLRVPESDIDLPDWMDR
ncbi:MAG: hypothetical protein HY922_03750 [Elusimicrobia bacterium]|nr:hypothetical protein [Elusimicrobiota bacterium]